MKENFEWGINRDPNEDFIGIGAKEFLQALGEIILSRSFVTLRRGPHVQRIEIWGNTSSERTQEIVYIFVKIYNSHTTHRYYFTRK